MPEPQPETSNHHANVTQVQHVLPAPGPGVEREPGQHPDKRHPPGDRKRFCIRWHVLIRMPSPPKRTTGSNMELGQFPGRFEHNPSIGMRARQTRAVERLGAPCHEGASAGQGLAQGIREITGAPARFALCPGLLDTSFYAARGVPGYAYGPGLPLRTVRTSTSTSAGWLNAPRSTHLRP